MATVVYYHTNCADGCAGALVAYMHFGDKANYIPIFYGSKLKKEDNKDNTVYFIDISPTVDFLNDNECAEIIILDHHKTALVNLFPHNHLFLLNLF